MAPKKGNKKGKRSPSLKMPHVFDALVRKGIDESSAAAISNDMYNDRKKGKGKKGKGKK